MWFYTVLQKCANYTGNTESLTLKVLLGRRMHAFIWFGCFLHHIEGSWERPGTQIERYFVVFLGLCSALGDRGVMLERRSSQYCAVF